MANSDTFSLYIHHGGKFIEFGGTKHYLGGTFVGKHNLDPDIFAYFDLEGEIESLGYQKWGCLAYRIPTTMQFIVIRDDVEVTEMLSYLNAKSRACTVYVDQGIKKGEGDGVTIVDKTEKTEKVKGVKGKNKVITEQVKGTKGKTEKTEQVKGLKGKDERDDSEYSYESEEEGGEDGDMGNDSDHSPSADEAMGSEGEDEEYRQAVENIRQEKGVIHDPDIVGYGEFLIEYDVVSEVESDYAGSDEIMEDSSDEEGDSRFRRTKKVYYDPKCDHKQMNVVLGMRFEDGLQCKNALRTWAIVKGLPIHFSRVSKVRLEAKCTPPCEWRCYGSMMKSENTFKIIRLHPKPHTCHFDIHNKQANYKWLAKQYIDVFRVRPEMSISEFQEDCNQRFQLQPSRGRLYRAKEHALELLRGTVKHHYAILRNYVAELVRVDREGRWAIAKDANNQMYPVAWGVVGVENEANWTWFLQILMEELGIRDGNGVAFISDQQKGLVNAVRSLAPYAEHRNCARHVYGNWKKEFKGATLMKSRSRLPCKRHVMFDLGKIGNGVKIERGRKLVNYQKKLKVGN